MRSIFYLFKNENYFILRLKQNISGKLKCIFFNNRKKFQTIFELRTKKNP